jgi:hypothetical protein
MNGIDCGRLWAQSQQPRNGYLSSATAAKVFRGNRTLASLRVPRGEARFRAAQKIAKIEQTEGPRDFEDNKRSQRELFEQKAAKVTKVFWSGLAMLNDVLTC